MVRNPGQLLTASLCLLIVASSSFAETPTPQYQLKEEHARTGTLLIRDAATKSDVALNRTYDELTPEDKAKVHGWYEHIAPGDEPPFPVDGLGPIYKAIDRARNIAPGQGELFLAVTVGADGKARDVQVHKASDRDITEFVASVLLLTRFKPAICDGKKCQMQFPLVIRFKQLNHASNR